MSKTSTVAVKIISDYWAGADEVFISGNPVAAETRLPAGMQVEMVQKTAFRLSNDGIVKLIVPNE